MKYSQILFLILYTHLAIGQQYFTGIETAWDNRFDQWDIGYYDEINEEEIPATLQLKWPLRNDWESWKYSIGDNSGEIKTKWDGNLNYWELRGGNSIVTISTKWRNDVNEWIISDGTINLKLKTRYTDNPNVWICDYGKMRIDLITEYNNDPRSWIIEDYMPEEIGLEMRMALIFIAVYQSFPK